MAEGFQEHNKKLIEEFLETLSELSKSRILKYSVTLTKVSRDFAKSFDSLTQSDLKEYLEGVNKRGDYSDWTKLGYRQLVKKFRLAARPEFRRMGQAGEGVEPC